MKFTKEEINLENGLKKEWLITNGLGGFASSTVIGANTRKYHGLLIAPLEAPARRHLVLSKLDESIQIGNNNYDLYTNVCENYISKGYEYQQSFEKEYVPQFTYKVEDTEIIKIIAMEYGKNTVGVYYKIKNGDKKATLRLAPVINFRDFHTMSSGHYFDVKQKVHKQKVKLIVDEFTSHPLYMNLSEGIYEEFANNPFENMFYIEEQKRGFYPVENHYVPGAYKVEINPNEEKEISFIFSLEENIEELNVKKFINDEIIRINKLFVKSELIDKKANTKEIKEKNELMKKLVIAADNFIVYRPSFGLHTIIAGYPWFLDWGRDSLISFEGLLLVTKRYKEAKEVLLTMIMDIKYGLVPNGYSGFDNRPLYNSADASLLLFEQVQKYIQYTDDYKFIKENVYEKMQEIVESYIQGIDVDDNNIYLDVDYLIVSGTPNTQNTWMDVRYNGYSVTPRNGKAVEINSLWYNALMILADLAERFKDKENVNKYKKLAKNCKKSFTEKFYNSRRKCLFDVLGDSKIRPNQLFSMSLTYPVLDLNSEIAKNTLATVEKKLLNKYGLKTLAKGEENYIDVYEGDGFKRDMSYHQGPTWTWLIGLYYNTLENMLKDSKKKSDKKQLEEKIAEFKKQTQKVFTKEIDTRGCIGSIAELYDSKTPFEPRGTIAQAWSVSEIIRIVK